MPLLKFMVCKFQRYIQLSFHWPISLTSALIDSTVPLASILLSTPSLTMVISLNICCFSIQLCSCASYCTFLREHLDLFPTIPSSLPQYVMQPFLLYRVYPDVDVSHPVKVLLKTFLWLDTSRTAIFKGHPRNILDGILWPSSFWPEVFSSEVCNFPELYLKHHVQTIFSTLPSYLLQLPQGKARTHN